MSENGNLTVVLQAGGESRRMGRSKATVPFLGEPLIWRGIRRLMPLADEFIVTTNEPENLGFLDELVKAGNLRLERDVYDERGALRGVCTAMKAATKDYVALVACDMVFPSPELLAAELLALEESGADAALPKTQLGYEPFHGVYRRATCLPVVCEAAEAGEARATAFLDEVQTCCFTEEMVAAIVPEKNCFVNVNTPDELHEVEHMLLAS